MSALTWQANQMSLAATLWDLMYTNCRAYDSWMGSVGLEKGRQGCAGCCDLCVPVWLPEGLNWGPWFHPGAPAEWATPRATQRTFIGRHIPSTVLIQLRTWRKDWMGRHFECPAERCVTYKSMRSKILLLYSIYIFLYTCLYIYIYLYNLYLCFLSFPPQVPFWYPSW